MVGNAMVDQARARNIRTDITPLIEAIAKDRAIVFIGAGASCAAGLPSWRGFLEKCLKRAKRDSAEGKWGRVEELLSGDSTDFLLAAELLQKGIGTRLEEYIWDTFADETKKPSAIHRAIAAIPFSFAVTTNYDTLLEQAYRNSRPLNVCTWNQSSAIQNAFKKNWFTIVKTHGSVGDGPSLVLTKTQYRDLIHLNDEFMSCLRDMLLYRTFLFVGYSFRDHDLLSLIDVLKLRFGDNFGPHYAIFEHGKSDPQLDAFYRDSYAIHTIEAQKPSNTADYGGRAQVIADVLREIGGRAALERHRLPDDVSFDSPIFSCRYNHQVLLDHVVEETGSYRGDIAIQDHKSDYRRVVTFATTEVHDDVIYTPGRRRGRARSSSEDESMVKGAELLSTGLISQTFVAGGNRDLYLYLQETDDRAIETLADRLPHAEYQVRDTRVRCELSVPIICDTEPVGVLNVESDVRNAYMIDHVQATRHYANQAAWIYEEGRQRNREAESLQYYFEKPRVFLELLRKSAVIDRLGLRLVLYKADYIRGQLIPFSDVPKNEAPRFNFEDVNGNALVRRVFQHRREEFLEDAEEAVRQRKIAEVGIKAYEISGPVFATPVTVHGKTAAILVCWCGKDSAYRSSEERIKQLRMARKRIKTWSQLIVNFPSHSTGSHAGITNLIQEAVKRIRDVDGGCRWDDALLNEPTKRRQIIRYVLGILLTEPCKLSRVRLWVKCRGDLAELGEFILAWSASLNPSDSAHPLQPHPDDEKDGEVDGELIVNAYRDLLAGGHDDAYCRHTNARILYDDGAQHQHRVMFDGLIDANQEVLRKDVEGSWIVVPLVKVSSGKRELIGFISADAHAFDPTKGEMRETVPPAEGDPGKLRHFQRCAMEFVAVLIEKVVQFCDEKGWMVDDNRPPDLDAVRQKIEQR